MQKKHQEKCGSETGHKRADLAEKLGTNNHELVKVHWLNVETATAMWGTYEDWMKVFMYIYPIPDAPKGNLPKLD